MNGEFDAFLKASIQINLIFTLLLVFKKGLSDRIKAESEKVKNHKRSLKTIEGLDPIDHTIAAIIIALKNGFLNGLHFIISGSYVVCLTVSLVFAVTGCLLLHPHLRCTLDSINRYHPKLIMWLVCPGPIFVLFSIGCFFFMKFVIKMLGHVNKEIKEDIQDSKSDFELNIKRDGKEY